MLPFFVIILLYTSYNTPCDAYPSGGETESESSGEESVDVMSDESVDSVNAILNLDDNAEESNDDGDNGYDIVHKVVVDQPIDEDDDRSRSSIVSSCRRNLEEDEERRAVKFRTCLRPAVWRNEKKRTVKAVFGAALKKQGLL